MSTSTAIKPEWYAPGGVLPEVIGTPSGPEADFYTLAERCAAGNWPGEAEAKRILNATGRTVRDLVGVVGTLRPSKPETAPAPVVANVATVAEQSKEIDQLQILEKEYRDNAEMIARMGVTKQQYLESRMRTDLLKRGIDPRSIGIGR